MKLRSMLLGVVLIVTGVLDNIISIVFWVQRHDVFWPFKMKFSLIFPHKNKYSKKKKLGVVIWVRIRYSIRFDTN